MYIDFIGNEIKVNDDVVFIQLGYRNLLKGKIIRISEKTVLIEHEMTNTCSTQTKQFHDQIIKIVK